MKTSRDRRWSTPGEQDVWFGAGFFGPERDGGSDFRWMGRQGVLRFLPADEPRFLELLVLSEIFDLSQKLDVDVSGRRTDLDLPHGWHRVSLAVPAGAHYAVLTLSALFPRAYYPADPRELGVRVTQPRLHGSESRHRAVAAQLNNAIENLREMLAGATILQSTPPALGIDLHGRCNVNPPCVFCEWDAMKRLEGPNAAFEFTPETLTDYGDFLDNAARLVNCSIGEPFMMRRLDDILDEIGERGKTLEMSTNGQILTDAHLTGLLGRDIHLYVSLDAATPETYAKLRNDRLPAILANLRKLVDAKGGRGGLPYLYLVFMPMAANVHELEDFVRLCADLDVDRLVLRPLNDSAAVDLEHERAGYRFEYQKELLPFKELIRIAGRADALCRSYEVPLANQLDFGSATEQLFRSLFEEGRRQVRATLEHHAPPRRGRPPRRPDPEGAALPELPEIPPLPLLGPADEIAPDLGRGSWPVCVEPWRNLYILRRGVLPCCYGGAPIAEMDDYRQAWNGPTLKAIRARLVDGHFHDYCLRSPACPIVRKSEKSGRLPWAQALLIPARRAWGHANRVLGGVPIAVVAPIKWVVSRMLRSVREPRYLIHHTKRMLRLGDAPLRRSRSGDR